MKTKKTKTKKSVGTKFSAPKTSLQKMGESELKESLPIVIKYCNPKSTMAKTINLLNADELNDNKIYTEIISRKESLKEFFSNLKVTYEVRMLFFRSKNEKQLTEYVTYRKRGNKKTIKKWLIIDPYQQQIGQVALNLDERLEFGNGTTFRMNLYPETFLYIYFYPEKSIKK